MEENMAKVDLTMLTPSESKHLLEKVETDIAKVKQDLIYGENFVSGAKYAAVELLIKSVSIKTKLEFMYAKRG